MKKNLLALFGALAVSCPVYGTILINEVHLNPPDPSLNSDGDYEYIELMSTTPGEYTTSDGTINGTPLTLLLIDANGSAIGTVNEAWRLAKEVPGPNPGDPVTVVPFKTGANGLLLLGDGYDNTPLGGPWNGIADLANTAFADPSSPSVAALAEIWSGMKPDNIKPNGGVNVLLVSGWTGLTNRIPTGVNATLGDVDVNDNNSYDWIESPQPAAAHQATVPWAGVVDSIGWTSSTRTPYTGAGTNISLRSNFPPAGGVVPDNVSRARGFNTPNDRQSWYGGVVTGGIPNTISFTTSFGGTPTAAITPGEATPGRLNRNSSKPAANFLINEVSVNPPGSKDSIYEYIEIINTTNDGGSFFASLADYSLLVIGSNGGDSTNQGRIVQAYDLSKFSTGSNGLLLIGDNYPTHNSWASITDPRTNLADPEKPTGSTEFSGFDAGELGENNGFTLLLVRGYKTASGVVPVPATQTDPAVPGTAVANLSTGALLANTGTTIGTIVDSIGFDEIDNNTGGFPVAAGNYTPGKSCAAVKINPQFGAAGALRYYNPDVLCRVAGNTSNSSTAAWYGGQYGSSSSYSIGLKNGKFFGGFKGETTPGRANLASAAVASNDLRLNEVHLNPPGTDSTEYVEIINPAGGIVGMNDLWLLVVSARASDLGEVKKIIDLRGQSTGPNGLAIFADGIEEPLQGWVAPLNGNFGVPLVSPLTLRDDPKFYSSEGIENTDINFGPDTLTPNSGLAVLLVRGFTGSLTTLIDLDADNNGVFDAGVPWTQLIDSVSFGSVVDPSVPSLTTGAVVPDNLSRYVGNVAANSAGAWFGGQMQTSIQGPLATDYSSSTFGTFKGAASPGRINVTAAPSSAASFVINEVNINPPGGDNDKEFIEIACTTGGEASTNSYSILLIDSDGANTGTVLKSLSLDGLATGKNGLLLLGRDYIEANRAVIPWDGTINSNGAYVPKPAAATRLGSPAGMVDDVIGGATDNGAVSLLLVRNFNGIESSDIDDGKTADGAPAGSADDGVIDAPDFWSGEITDAIGMRYWDTNRKDAAGAALPPALVGRVYGGADLSQGEPAVTVGYTPDSIARYRDNTTALSAPAWYGGDLSGTAGTATAYDAAQRFPLTFKGRVTPGLPNIPTAAYDALDTDSDGLKNLVEEAINSIPGTPDAIKGPQVARLDVAGTIYPAMTYTRLKNAPGLLYEVQTSSDLTTWVTTSDVTQVSSVDNPDGLTQTVVVRPSTAWYNTLPATAKKAFLRLKITRQ